MRFPGFPRYPFYHTSPIREDKQMGKLCGDYTGFEPRTEDRQLGAITPTPRRSIKQDYSIYKPIDLSSRISAP